MVLTGPSNSGNNSKSHSSSGYHDLSCAAAAVMIRLLHSVVVVAARPAQYVSIFGII